MAKEYQDETETTVPALGVAQAVRRLIENATTVAECDYQDDRIRLAEMYASLAIAEALADIATALRTERKK